MVAFVYFALTLAVTAVTAVDEYYRASRVMLRSHSTPHAFTLMRMPETCFMVDPESGNVDVTDASACASLEGWADTTDAAMIRTHLEMCQICAEQNDDFSFFSYINHYICVTDNQFIGKHECVALCSLHRLT